MWKKIGTFVRRVHIKLVSHLTVKEFSFDGSRACNQISVRVEIFN